MRFLSRAAFSYLVLNHLLKHSASSLVEAIVIELFEDFMLLRSKKIVVRLHLGVQLFVLSLFNRLAKRCMIRHKGVVNGVTRLSWVEIKRISSQIHELELVLKMRHVI